MTDTEIRDVLNRAAGTQFSSDMMAETVRRWRGATMSHKVKPENAYEPGPPAPAEEAVTDGAPREPAAGPTGLREGQDLRGGDGREGERLARVERHVREHRGLRDGQREPRGVLPRGFLFEARTRVQKKTRKPR